MVSSSCCVC